MGEVLCEQKITCMCVSRDGQLYLGSWSSVVGKLVSTQVHVNLRESQPYQLFRGHLERVYRLALSPDDKLLASTSKDTRMILWDVRSGDKLKVIMLYNSSVMAVAFSGCGQYLYTGRHTSMTQYSVASGAVIRRMGAHQGYLSHIVSSTDGRVFCASEDGSFSMWDVPTGALSRLYRDESKTKDLDIVSLALSPDNQRLYSSGIDQVVCEWNVGYTSFS